MNAPDTMFLPDVQSSADRRNLAIERVGVRSLAHPLLVATPHGPQPTVASVDMYVALPRERKGTHMSRFIEVLQAPRAPLGAAVLRDLLRQMLLRLEAERGWIELRFTYFVQKTAPVSGVQSLMDYQAMLRVDGSATAARLTQKVVVPVMSLCPCSKKVSDYGAHNQRSHITLTVEPADGAELPLEDQIRVAERAASCELWPLLKRADEKYVTEKAYDNPKFVEDLVRDAALALQADARAVAWVVECENFESIHNHSAYAAIEHDRRSAPSAR